MASYRITARPWVDNLEENVYDVEDEAERRAHSLMKATPIPRMVIKEYY